MQAWIFNFNHAANNNDQQKYFFPMKIMHKI